MRKGLLILTLVILSLFISVNHAITQTEDDFEWMTVLNFESDKNSYSTSDSISDGDFHEGLARVGAYGKGGYINKKGKTVSNHSFLMLKIFLRA